MTVHKIEGRTVNELMGNLQTFLDGVDEAKVFHMTQLIKSSLVSSMFIFMLEN